MIKSISYSQEEIIKSIIDLHIPEGKIQCDITYGNGAFYKNIERPWLCYDIDPLFDFVIKADSCHIPNKDSSLSSIMFDPPFLTYIKKGREHNCIMSKRFSGYWSYDELSKHYKQTLSEASRTLKKDGKLIFQVSRHYS